jgi:GTPase SAR1 family protein
MEKNKWHSFAGKTALRRSLVQSNVARHHSKMWKPLLAFNQMGIKGALFGEKQDERTRGIEISVVEDGGIVVSIWDLAGQEEFHAFHNYMMPNFADFVNPCSFLFVFDPTKQTNRVEKKYGRKELKEFEDDLTYWLQFIASNTPTSTTFLPRLLVILTHADRDLDGGLVEWAKHVVDELRERFQNVVHIFTDIYAVNARSSEHVIPVLDFVLKNSRYLLSRTQVFPECVAMRLLLSNRIRGHPNQPIISWSTFSELCNEILPKGMGESSQLDVVERKHKALAAHLHHMGDIIYFQGLEFIVVNPGWFCHNVMGFVINFRGIQHMTDKGFATKEYMQHVLNQSLSLATKNILSGGWGIHLQPADLMHLMLKLNICYEKDPGNLDAGVFIPAILDANFSATERAAIAEGKRKLVWPIPTSQAPVKAIFVGRRLECNNPFHTFLTPGFFPRLQVVLHNAFYSNGSLSVDYKLDKGLIILNFKGIEVLVESSGDVGYYIDVLVRSSLSHSETLKIIEEDILKTIHQYCASSDGCQGVWLVESILRPQCVQELTLLKYR